MDPASLIGLVVAVVLMVYGITGSNGMSAIFSFLDRDSAVITFGGALMAVMAGMTIPRFVTGLKSFTQIFSKGKLSAQEMIMTAFTNIERAEVEKNNKLLKTWRVTLESIRSNAKNGSAFTPFSPQTTAVCLPISSRTMGSCLS